MQQHQCRQDDRQQDTIIKEGLDCASKVCHGRIFRKDNNYFWLITCSAAVKVGAKGVGKGLAEELIHADAFAPAFFKSVVADGPSVQVEGLPAAGQLGDADGVKAAGNGLAPPTGSGKKAPFDGAKTVSVPFESGVGALLFPGRPFHHWRYQVAVPVHLEESGRFGGGLSGGRHEGGINRIPAFQFIQFRGFQRCSAVPDDAAATLAAPVVAGEILQHHILGNQDVTNLDNGSERTHSTTYSMLHPLRRACRMACTSSALMALIRSR